MGQATVRLTNDRELRLYRRLRRIEDLILDGTIPYPVAMQMTRGLLETYTPEDPILREQPAPKRDLAEERRLVIEAAFHRRGHTTVVVPKPAASNRAFARWEESNRALFYHPANSQMTYEAFMASVGQGEHWTVVDEAQRAEIGWEPTAVGYWFLAEVTTSCPRLNTSWNGLTGSIKLPSLEEYAIVYWTHRDLTGERIDASTWCLLRTRYGRGALSASDGGGGVSVYRDDASSLSVPYEDGGGRAVEVVNSAT